MGGVPSGDRSVDFSVTPGSHLLRADAVIGGETVSASRMATIPAGYVCTWTVTDPQETNPGIQRLIVALPGTRSDLLKRKLTAVISLTVPN